MSSIKITYRGDFLEPTDQIFSVFENEYGEQWVAARRGHHLVIAGADMDWEEIVIDREALDKRSAWKLYRGTRSFVPAVLARVVLTPEELAWALAVVQVASLRREPPEPEPQKKAEKAEKPKPTPKPKGTPS